jgi:hypothetical protein
MDNEIIELKGISYIIAYLLIITDNDELNIYYFMVSLLCNTFSNKYGLRGLYVKDQPLLRACISVFQKHLNNHFPELSEHFKEINLSLYSWISLWIQMCYINVFPNYFLLRVWDYFLIHGISFLLSLGLVIIEFLYEDLITTDKKEEIFEIFKKLNPNLKSSYKKIRIIDYNIEDLISKAIKNYSISNDEIQTQLITSFPEYKSDIKYYFNDIKDKRDSLSSINDKYLTESRQGKTDNDTSDECCSMLDISSDCQILEENVNENIELSISQRNGLYEILLTGSSCEDIENENDYINEHIKDLINKQVCLSKSSILHNKYKENFL